MRKRIFSISLGALLALSIPFSVPAFAAGVDPANATPVQREQAQQRFLKGKDRFDKNDLNGALEEFRASLEIVASPNARLYVARTLRELGKLVDAYAEYGRTAAEAKEHEHEDGRYGKAAQAALAERDAIAPQIGFVILAIKNANDTTTVNVAGNSIAHAAWGDPIPVKPGSVQVDVATNGGAPVHKTLTLKPGERQTFELDANAPGVFPTNPNPTPEQPATTSKKPNWLLPAAIVGGGVGVVGLVTFIIGGVASQNTYSDLQAKCGTAACPASFSGEISGGKTQQAIANVGLVVGIVGVVAGGAFLTWWLLPQKSSSTSAALTIGPGSIGLAGTF